MNVYIYTILYICVTYNLCSYLMLYIYSSTDHVPIEKKTSWSRCFESHQTRMFCATPAARAKGLIPRPRRPI